MLEFNHSNEQSFNTQHEPPRLIVVANKNVDTSHNAHTFELLIFLKNSFISIPVKENLSHPDQAQTLSEAEKWKRILGPDFPHEHRRKLLIETGTTAASLADIMQIIGMAPSFDSDPPPGFMEKDEDTEELTPEERQYVDAFMKHNEIVENMAREYFKRLEDRV